MDTDGNFRKLVRFDDLLKLQRLWTKVHHKCDADFLKENNFTEPTFPLENFAQTKWHKTHTKLSFAQYLKFFASPLGTFFNSANVMSSQSRTSTVFKKILLGH